MRVITERSLIRDVAARWAESYPNERFGKDKPRIGKQLAALDPEKATAEMVIDIIGNDSWTSVPECDECGAVGLAAVVEVGAEPDYESSTARICVPCLRKAVKLARDA